MGLIVDLGYVSLELIRECERLDIYLVIRLKKGWKPRVLRTNDELGELLEIDGEPVLDDLLDMASGDYHVGQPGLKTSMTFMPALAGWLRRRRQEAH